MSRSPIPSPCMRLAVPGWASGSGVVVLCTTVMLVAMTGVAYASWWLSLVRPPDLSKDVQELEAEEAWSVDYDQRASDEVLVARRTVRSHSSPPTSRKIVAGRPGRPSWRDQGRPARPRRMAMEPAVDEVAEAREQPGQGSQRLVPRGSRSLWEFAGLNPNNDAARCSFASTASPASARSRAWSGEWVVLGLGAPPRTKRAARSAAVRSSALVASMRAPEFGWHSDAHARVHASSAYQDTQDGERHARQRHRRGRHRMFLDLPRTWTTGRRSTSTAASWSQITAEAEGGPSWRNYYRTDAHRALPHLAAGRVGSDGRDRSSPSRWPAIIVVFFFVIGLVGPWFLSFTNPRRRPRWSSPSWRKMTHLVVAPASARGCAGHHAAASASFSPLGAPDGRKDGRLAPRGLRGGHAHLREGNGRHAGGDVLSTPGVNSPG